MMTLRKGGLLSFPVTPQFPGTIKVKIYIKDLEQFLQIIDDKNRDS